MKKKRAGKIVLNKTTVSNLSHETMGKVMAGDLNTYTSERCESVFHCATEFCTGGSGQTGSQDFCNGID